MNELLQRMALNGNLLDKLDDAEERVRQVADSYLTYLAGDGRYPHRPYEGGVSGVLNGNTQFGAVGDGVEDDTAAIQAMFDAVGDDRRGTTCYLRPGTYLISEPVTISTDYTRFVCDGQWSRGPQAAPGGGSDPEDVGGGAILQAVTDDMSAVLVVDAIHAILDGVHVDCDEKAKIGIKVNATKHNFQIRHCSVKLAKDYGLYIEKGTGTHGGKIIGGRYSQDFNLGIPIFNGSSDGIVLGVHCNRGDAGYVQNGGGTIIMGCHLTGNSLMNGPTLRISSTNNTIIGNYIDSGADPAIVLFENNAHENTFVGNFVFGASITDNAGAAIAFDSSTIHRGVNISGNRIRGGPSNRYVNALDLGATPANVINLAFNSNVISDVMVSGIVYPVWSARPTMAEGNTLGISGSSSVWPQSNAGTATIVASNGQTVFNIPHGLWTAPRIGMIQPANSNARSQPFYVVFGNTNVQANFASAPAAAGQNVVLNWWAEV